MGRTFKYYPSSPFSPSVALGALLTRNLGLALGMARVVKRRCLFGGHVVVVNRAHKKSRLFALHNCDFLRVLDCRQQVLAEETLLQLVAVRVVSEALALVQP